MRRFDVNSVEGEDEEKGGILIHSFQHVNLLELQFQH